MGPDLTCGIIRPTSRWPNKDAQVIGRLPTVGGSRCVGMARATLLSMSRLPTSSGVGSYGGPYFLTTVVRCMEEPVVAKYSHIRLASSPEMPKDEGISTACDTGRPSHLRSMCRCWGDLRASVHYLPRWSGNRPMWTDSRSHPGRPFGDPSGQERNDYRWSGSDYSPYSGPFRAIRTKSYSGDASPQSMPSSMTRGDLSSHGIGVAQASRLMYPFNLTLNTRHITLWQRGGLSFFLKKKLFEKCMLVIMGFSNSLHLLKNLHKACGPFQIL